MDSVLGKIGFDWHLAIVNLVNVFLIFLVLKKWAFKPIGEMIEKRKAMVAKSISDVEAARDQATKAEEEKQALLAQARTQAQAIIEASEQESKGIVDTGRQKALKEHEDILHKAQLAIQRAQKDSMDQLKVKAAGLVSVGIKKILAEEVDSKMNERIVKKAQVLTANNHND